MTCRAGGVPAQSATAAGIVAPVAVGRPAAIGSDGLVRFFLGAALVVVFPWLVLSNSPDGGRNAMWIPCLLIAMWSGIRLTGIIASGAPRLFELSWWLFCYLFMGLAPAAQIHADRMAETTPRLDPGRDAAAVVVVAMGVVAFELGRLWARSRPRPSTVTDLEVADPVRDATLSSARSLWLLAAVTPFAVFFIMKVGPANFFLSRTEFGDATDAVFAEPSITPMLLAISWVPALVVLHRIIARRRAQPGSTLTGGEMIGVVVAVSLIVFANNPISSSRYAFGTMVLSFAVLFGAFATTTRARRSMLLIVLGFIFVFPIADAFRREETGRIEVSPLDEYSGNADYDAFGQISNAITVVADDGFSFAQQPLGVALFWVPRSVWADKPVDTGIYLAEERGYDFNNLSAPLWAELFVVGGHLIVVAGLFALGHFATRADDRLVERLRGLRRYSVAAAFMPFYLIILLRGSLLQATALLATLAMSVWLTRPVPGIRSRPAPRRRHVAEPVPANLQP